MGPTGTADTICHVNSHSLHGVFFLEGNYHAQATLGVLAASKPSLQPAKPTQQQRRCSGLNVLSQASFPPGLLACCYLSSLVLGVFSSGSAAQAQGASTFPMDLGAEQSPGTGGITSPAGRGYQHRGHHVAAGFRQPGVIFKIRLLIWKVDPISSAVLLSLCGGRAAAMGFVYGFKWHGAVK